MSVSRTARLARVLEHRKSGAPIVMLTAYDFISARIAEEAGIDIILVGDSAANSVLGYQSTREVSVDEMLMLTRASRRGAPNTTLVGDMPFTSYEDSDEHAVATAMRFIDAGADLVKLEGAGAIASRVGAMVRAGIAVVGHVGLLPQSARTSDDLRMRGRTSQEALDIVRDAIELDKCGVSLLVIEAVPVQVVDAVSARVRAPLIGIGAGPGVHGQVLVYPDMLGLTPGSLPKFVRSYADLHAPWLNAIRAYARDVRTRTFPSAAEVYGMPDDARVAFEAQVETAFPVAAS